MFLSSCINPNGESNSPKIITSSTITTIIILMIILYKMYNSKPSKNIYVVNIACFRPKKYQQLTREDTMRRTIQFVNHTSFTEKTLQILGKMTNATGIGNCTSIPESLMRDPPDLSMGGARHDAREVMFGAVDTLLRVTRVDVGKIGVVVVNNSVFSPVPSLASVIVNKYKFRDDVKSYCLCGMGCSAGIIAVDLASQLLQVHPNTYAIVVSTDVVGASYYTGNDPYKLGINCVMRVGGAAILLSNHPSDHGSSKYQLKHAVRTNTSCSDESYHSIFQEDDPQGHVGIAVSRDFLQPAKNTIKAHFLVLGPKILPLSEILKFMINYVLRKMNTFNYPFKIGSYLPNFGLSVSHFIPHVGAKVVLDVVEMTLKVDVEAARMTLHRFGNSSSSSIWYGLAYNEAKGKVKKGDRIWIMGLGSGFKCNSIILKALKDVDHHEEHNPWSQEIDDFPVELGRPSSNFLSLLDDNNN